jgi:hypothetical protein
LVSVAQEREEQKEQKQEHGQVPLEELLYRLK